MNKNIAVYNEQDFLEFAEKYAQNSKLNFNYKSYIMPHSEMRELLGRIIEEFQYLELRIKELIKIAVEKNLYTGKTKFNFDNYISARTIINALKNDLIEENIAEQLKALIKFRNYTIHGLYLNSNREKIENSFPNFLFMIFEANDYITNVITRITEGTMHIPNVFEDK